MKAITHEFLSTLRDFTCVGKPDDISSIDKAEAELELSFSEDYKALAAQYGAISYRGHHLSGISPFPGNDVVALTKENRSYNSAVPMNLYVIEEAHIDGIVIWQDSSGRVYQTQPSIEPKQIFDCLYDYIAQ